MEIQRVKSAVIGGLLAMVFVGIAAGCLRKEREPSPVMRILPGREIPALALEAEGEAVEYPGERLQKYITDGAYIPMSFGFRTLAVARYRDLLDTRNVVLVEVYEVETALDAVALLRFAHRALKPAAWCSACRQGPHTYAFARGRYYVVVRNVVMAKERWDRVGELAASMAPRIPQDETGLDRLDRLPVDAAKGPVFFVRTGRLLGELVALPPGGAFALHTAATVALVADRADGQGRFALIEYPDEETATAAADLARKAVGKAWSPWAVTQVGRYVLTFVRHTGRCTQDDVQRTVALVKRIAAEYP